ncbi:N-acetylmuramate alpha-1-phosphate uridylyltransferase MurU [Endozoicomonas sp. OPT23]|uniref:N-acetylmuramate alpha-1-phosphate uridylyltransferase MurU n=1 Tax=Endozoicomonas sp. OPT23 TaxID=2072845 RepID=UPI00129AB1E9|nr:nucleotidyltransferase family protein [Endozoicomonas sp. OPT23]
MILAAGLGTRLRPLTLDVPKPLVKAAGKPLIVYHIENLAAAGFRDIVVNCAWLGHKLVDFLGNGHQLGVNISYSHESEPLETGGGILNAMPLLGDEPFLVVNGDVFIEYDFSTLPSTIDGLAHLVLVDNPDFKEKGDFSLDCGQVRSEGEHLFTFSGLSVLTPELFEGQKVGSSFRLAPLLVKAMMNDRVSGEYFTGVWTDVGTPERLAELEKYLNQSRK